MDHQTFRSMAHELVDWVADYLERGHQGPISQEVPPGFLLNQLPPNAPDRAEDFDHLFSDFKNMILPGLVHWNDPRFYGYFPANHSAPSILAEILAAGLNVNAMSWATSPAATELEIRMMEWLGQLIGLPWPGTIQDTASTGTLCAILAAREDKLKANQSGMFAQQPLALYVSDQAHSSVVKGARIAGLGDQYTRVIPSNAEFAMDLDALTTAIDGDLSSGITPGIVVATVGTTSSTAVDPVPAIATLCRRHHIWLHVDAALAGTAAILPEMRWLMNGVDQADSFLFNPHKWMFTNFDCSAFFCKDPLKLKQALAIQPEYLKSKQDHAVENFRDWSIQLGRGFRALKLWFVMRTYGKSGLQARIREHLAMTQWFAKKVEEHPDLHLLNQPRINTVCFHLNEDEKTKSLLQAINRTGDAFLTHTVLNKRFIIRVAFGQAHATQKHAETLWQTLTHCLHRQNLESAK